jgi:hypothetical protein
MGITSGDERRRLDIEHPELTPTSAEKEERKALVFTLVLIGNIFILLFMIVATIFITLISFFFTGMAVFSIVLVGMILNVTISLILAYIVGTKTRKIYKDLL